MITPINNHLIIEPVEHESFIASSKGSFDEIGIVKAVPVEYHAFLGGTTSDKPMLIEVGDRVYFDSWLAAKYPTGEGDKTFWLVNYEDIRAVQKQTETETQG